MNKALKVGLITTGIILPSYLGLSLYLRNKNYAESEKRFKENNTEKKLLIMQILISKGLPNSETNISSYLKYSEEELKNMLNANSNGYEYDYSAMNADYYDYYN